MQYFSTIKANSIITLPKVIQALKIWRLNQAFCNFFTANLHFIYTQTPFFAFEYIICFYSK